MNNEQELSLVASPVPHRQTTEPVIKASFVDFGFNEMKAVQEDPAIANAFAQAKTIKPPYDAVTLFGLREMSGALQVNVDIYQQNVDGGDHQLVPIINPNQANVKKQIAAALVSRKIRERLKTEPAHELAARLTRVATALLPKTKLTKEEGAGEDEEDEEDTDLEEALAISAEFGVTEKDINVAIDTLRQNMLAERAEIEMFLRYCSLTESFKSLRKQKTRDLETVGNAYWEILRNPNTGKPSEIRYIQAQTMRLCEDSTDEVEIVQVMRIDPINEDKVSRKRRFRTFVQHIRGKVVYFKEFGDPRTTSSVTGKHYKDKAAMLAAEEKNAKKNPSLEATEVYHFRIPSALSPYGVPRWIPKLLAVLGNRYAEEINLAFFENKSIPPMAILVSGGRLATGDVDRLRDFIKNEVKGKRNFHKILILEAEAKNPMGITNGRVTIEIKPLQHYIPDDGQFMKYMERNDDDIGSVFRNPRIMRANTQDFNRATADAAMQVADNQVYGPLREEFDWFMNDVIFEALEVKYYRFLTLAPKNTNMEQLAGFLDKAGARGYLSIPELRRLSEPMFQTEFQKPDTTENLDIPLELLRLNARKSATEGQDGGVDDQSEGVIPPSKNPGGNGATPESEEMMDVNKKGVDHFLDLLATVETRTRELARKEAGGVFAQRVEAQNDPEL